MILNIPKEDRGILDQIMVDLVREGVVLKTKKGKFIEPKSVKLIVGNFIGNEKGFGFVEVEGENDDEECEVFFRTEDIDLDFTDDYKEELQDDPYNYTVSEVNELEDTAQDEAEELEGYEWRCYFEDSDDLIDILNDWEDGDYAISDFDGYDCEGDYFN